MSNKLFVGGLSWNTDDEMLRQAFEPHGTVTQASVVMDRDTDRSRGFGFVTMESAEQAQTAIQAMDSTVLDGRTIRVSVAVSAKAAAVVGGGGGGGPARWWWRWWRRWPRSSRPLVDTPRTIGARASARALFVRQPRSNIASNTW
jgi:RNA recognition motif-containing protein